MRALSNLALRKAHRNIAKGRIQEASAVLDTAIQSRQGDLRLVLRRSLITSDYRPLEEAVKDGAGAANLFIAMNYYRQGDFKQSGLFAQKTLDTNPGNMNARALFSLSSFVQGDQEILINSREDFAHVSAPIQAMALTAAESAIIKSDPENKGAKESDVELEGFAGWVLNRLDDLAVLIYWFLSRALNLLINIANSEQRKVYAFVSDADKLEGFKKREEAVRLFKQALEIDPANPEALESMIIYSIDTGDHAQGQKYLDRLLEQSEGDLSPGQERWKADLLFLAGDYINAGPLYEKTAENFKLSYFEPYRAGLVKLREGDEASALEWFVKSLERVNPDLVKDRIGALSGPA